MRVIRNSTLWPTTFPDENFAREILQLFSIGLVELNTNGNPKIVGGEVVETYTNDDIENFAKIFTGFDYVGGEKTSKSTNMVSPMAVTPAFHDTGAKTLLAKGPNTNVSAGKTAEEDLDLAIDNIFGHPTVGPFISKLLIQRLVTSNPSNAYVKKVAEKFNNNGSGVRGDLSAV